MARVTLRIPESLHEQLATQAQAEGVSMNQYLVYMLAQASTAAEISAQRTRFDELVHRIPAEDAEAHLQALVRSRAN